ncbi:murein biosynthesis integral membrane protein MurJ [bacterium (Candidatus Torokbacteria) CG09_land_8_20_14_0_10_42_11]|nr:MAG: murein biosynthesis integral membrane protein MurJ [bacterium (Candidatus Torokbacteria) CG09_land_8_20_14_0_10_42_11]
MRYHQAAKSTFVITAVTLIAGVLGFAQQTLTAYIFGAGQAVDAFVASRTIPDIFTKILQVGILSIVFVPIFVKYIESKEEEKAWRIAVNLFNIISVFFIALIALGMIFTPLFVKIIVPGFDSATQRLTVNLTLILFPAILFNILTILGTSILHAFKKFNLPALIKLILPLIIIIGLLIFRQKIGIYILSFAFLATAILEFLVIFQALYKQGLRYSFSFHFRDPVICKMIVLVSPFIFSTILAQASTVTNRMLASELTSGSLSALYYAERIIKLVSQVFLFAIPIVAFPTFAAKIAKKNYKALFHAVSLTIRLILFVIIPVSIGLILMRLPLVQIIFQRGEFSFSDSQATAYALFFFSLGLFATGITNILANVFYSLEKTKILVKIAVVVIIFNIILNFILVRYLSHGGLALATSLTNILSLVFHAYFLGRLLPRIRTVLWQKYYLKIIFASFPMGIFVYLASRVVYTNIAAENLFGQIFAFSLVVIPSIAIYLAFAYLLKLKELKLITDILRHKLKN